MKCVVCHGRTVTIKTEAGLKHVPAGELIDLSESDAEHLLAAGFVRNPVAEAGAGVDPEQGEVGADVSDKKKAGTDKTGSASLL